jgi:hypothetical protein
VENLLLKMAAYDIDLHRNGLNCLHLVVRVEKLVYPHYRVRSPNVPIEVMLEAYEYSLTSSNEGDNVDRSMYYLCECSWWRVEFGTSS